MTREPGFSTNFAAANGLTLMWLVVIGILIAIISSGWGLIK